MKISNHAVYPMAANPNAETEAAKSFMDGNDAWVCHEIWMKVIAVTFAPNTGFEVTVETPDVGESEIIDEIRELIAITESVKDKLSSANADIFHKIRTRYVPSSNQT